MGGKSETSTSTSSSKSSPIYNPRVGPLFEAESDLVKNLLFPLEGSIIQPQQRLLNPNMPITGQQKAQIAGDSSYAGQVANQMPGSSDASEFIDLMPRAGEWALRQEALPASAKIGRALIDPRFQGLLGPTGQHSESTSEGGGGGGPSTAQTAMGAIGTAASVAATVAAIA